MGFNVVGSEGEVWKRHRRIAAPAFNHATYRNVWSTTARVYADMLDKEGWKNVNETPITNFNKITHKVCFSDSCTVKFTISYVSWLSSLSLLLVLVYQ